MVEYRDKTTTEGRGLGHSFADDNVERGESDADFIKRRPKYPFGDDPRAREIDFEDTSGSESNRGRQIFRGYRGQAPIEGQEFGMPSRVGKIFKKVSDLRPETINRATNDAANAAQQATELAILEATNFQALYPTVTISSPSPGATFSPGGTITVQAPASDLRSLLSATLEIDNTPVERLVLDRRDQDSTTNYTFTFFYPIPSNKALGSMDITVRAFNMATSNQGMIADDALNTSDIQTGVGTLDGRPGSATSAADYQKLFNETGMLKSPEGVVSITVNIV